VRVATPVQRKRSSLAAAQTAPEQFERQIGNPQSQAHLADQEVGHEAVERVVPVHIGMAVVRSRRNKRARGARQPLHGIMRLQPGLAQSGLLDATQHTPIQSAHGRVPRSRGLSSRIGDDRGARKPCLLCAHAYE
jgi:hypothetical protein